MDANGTLNVIIPGTRLSYEDMANPKRTGTVEQIKVTRWGTDYLVKFDDASDVMEVWSDLRQRGWRAA